MTANNKLTVRLPADLDQSLSEQAKKEDLSKNQAIKAAVRKWLAEKRVQDRDTEGR